MTPLFSSVAASLPPRLPLVIATILLAAGGTALLNRAAAQARDTTRKHHLEDIEHALYAARNRYGTFPPYDAPTWCGQLNDVSSSTRQQIEDALRAQNEKYANPAKPFPTDPHLTIRASRDYFYWKHSPASFELYAALEANPTGERRTHFCPGTNLVYDYGLSSIWREERYD